MAALQAVTTVQSGETTVSNGQKALGAVHVAGSAVTDRQQSASTTAQNVVRAEQQKINQNTSQLQPSDQSDLTDQVTAAQNAADAAIKSAQSADEVNQAVADLNQKLAAIDLDLAHRVGQFQLAAANEQIQAAIDGDVTLLPDVKAAQQANRIAALRKTTADLAATTTVASAQQSASDGVTVIQAAHQVGQSLADQKQSLVTNLQQADQVVKSRIDADQTLPQAEKDRQKAAIDRAEAQTINQINTATTATAAKQVADTGTTTNEKIYVPGQTITGNGGQAAQFKGQVTNQSAVVQQAINTAATRGQITANQEASLTRQLQRVVSAAQAAGTAATNADQILAANQQLTADLTSVQYNLAIASANYQLLVAYSSADQAINDDPTLSNQEKADQAEIVNARWNTGQQNLATAKTTEQVSQIATEMVTAISQIHHGGQSVEERMQSYTAKIQAATAQVVVQTNQDKSLSSTGQAIIVEAVQNNRDWYLNELQSAKSVVEAEMMVQDDLNAMTFGQNATSQLGQGKADWFARIYNELKTTDQSINGYSALSSDEKSALLQTMQSLVAATNTQIRKGQTLDQTVQLLQDLMLDLTKLNLHASQRDATNQLQSALVTTKTAITADRSLAHQAVQDQIQAAQAAYDQASAQVQQAGDVRAVASALAAGQQAVEESHESQADFAEQLPKLDQQVDDTVKATTNAINQDRTLTATEKQQQINKVNQKAENLKKAMANAVDLREADEALSQGLPSLNGSHQPGLAVNGSTGQAAQLKAQVVTASQQEQNQIDQAVANGLITTEQKDALTTALQAANTQTQAAANQAENADQIQATNAAWQSALAQSQTALAKDIAFHQLGVAQSQADAAIIADGTLSQQEKLAQQMSLQQVVDTWTKSINDGQNADQVTGASTTAVQIINGIHHSGQPVADRLAGFNQQVVAASMALVAKTMQQANLSVAGQQIIVRAINGMQVWFINELKSAPTVVAAETMVQDDVTALALGQPAQTPVAEAKADWVNRLYQGLQAVDQTIHGYQNLTDDDVTDLMNRLGELTDETNDQVQEGASATVVTAALQKFLDALPTLTFAASQQDAVRQLEQTGTATQQAISTDRTLSDQQVQNQQQAAQTALDQAIQAVKAAQGPTAMTQALADGRAAVENAHQEQGDLTQQLPKLDQQVDDDTQLVVDVINQDQTLSADEKQQQIKAVQQQAADLKNELKNAVDPRAAYQDLDRGLQKLSTIHQNGQALKDQEQLTQKTVDQEAVAAKQKLPDGQQAAFDSAIDAARQDAEKSLAQAKSADDIQQVLTKFKQTVDSLQEQAVTNAQAQAEQETAKSQAVTAITHAVESAKQALPAGQELQFEPAIDQAKQKALDEVGRANDQKAIAAAVADCNKELTSVQQQAKEQDAAEQKAKKEADQAINNAEKQLPADEQPQLIDKVQPAEQEFLTEVQRARTVGDVQDAYQQFLDTLQQISQQVQQESAQQQKAEKDSVERPASPATLMNNLFPAKIVLPDTWEVERSDQPLTFLAVTMASLSIGLAGFGLRLRQLKVNGGKNRTDK
ncbi:DUF1542 domain-containing protein [Fructobacillus evanidus]|uniref:Outer membrane porin OmpC/OmpF/PhoE (OmpC) n=2 Tax=Fructobacillus evanidus TaxID=3064281 RepID=A0ABM9MW32_9LACO|nr:Outer membrane porin OmpC/OmpF/PhoE (OmpC) [Fructobacillus sp. LMG 32999]CAK1229895.1 Outer membrane porin OmpC/OmpF/PhoE (OmpC) [Fructobacillus sp. LMG 32999]CAK1232672.1 Outer membrane porin OmpC/OmpF/PhoE (OmpC) [Fructobacillus sp. LMG 32999]CAK1232841.1 Outer membrane porin OmpC/OmpF/PhoE (OmpC) [Fructobacillus sp. LMG 32999]CAK1233965.1 Outer membrane porin OmpC/OmpF/PhoE (OmpC) [Fructobacillus sp. LMG 32999]